jgi:hypothetical protein
LDQNTNELLAFGSRGEYLDLFPNIALGKSFPL